METTCANAMLKPGEAIQSEITKESVPGLVKKFFGLEATKVKELNGYYDKNFFIEVSKSENPFIKNLSEKGYVFKIVNSKDSEFPDVIEIQNNLMQHLNKSNIGVRVSTPLKNLEGHYYSYEVAYDPDEVAATSNNTDVTKSRKKHIIRLLEYIPGQMMKDIKYTRELNYEVGKLAGTLYNEFKNFDSEPLKNRKIIWQLGSLPSIHTFLFAIKDENKLKLVKEVLYSWESLVAPLIPSLEKNVIHGDINEQNVIVSTSIEKSSTFRNIFGLLDFGDVSVSPCIFELAISIAHVVLEVNIMDFQEASGYVVAGYSSERTITSTEWDILRECVAARFSQSLVLGAYSYLNDPGNEYVLCTAKVGWERLRQFWFTPKDELISKWKTMMSIRLP